MAEYEWSLLKLPKGHLNVPYQKFAPFRMLKTSYRFTTIWGVPVCSCKGQIYCANLGFIWFTNLF